jgi:hypothetical protein
MDRLISHEEVLYMTTVLPSLIADIFILTKKLESAASLHVS